MTGHISYWKFSSRMMWGPPAQIVNSAIDNDPIVAFAVVLLHLLEAVVLRFLHSEKRKTKNSSQTSTSFQNRQKFTQPECYDTITSGRWLYIASQVLIGWKQWRNKFEPIRSRDLKIALWWKAIAGCLGTWLVYKTPSNEDFYDECPYYPRIKAARGSNFHKPYRCHCIS